MIFLWVQFLICAAIILLSGSRLVKDAEVIASRTRLGGTLVGIFLLSVVTSLPELLNGAGSILIAQAPDLAVGDIVGSLLFNLIIFSVACFFLSRADWQALGTPSLLLSGVLSICLTGIFVLAQFLSQAQDLPRLGWVSYFSLIILLGYFLAAMLLYRYEKTHQQQFQQDHPPLEDTKLSTQRAIRGFAINSLFVVGAGTYLPVVASRIAEISGLTNSFMGVLFIGITTSLPEMIVVFHAIRMKLIHMALGDVFGSNLFNLTILFFNDLLYWRGDLFQDINPILKWGAFASILITAFFVIALKMKLPGKVLGRIRISAVLAILIYVLTTWATFKYS